MRRTTRLRPGTWAMLAVTAALICGAAAPGALTQPTAATWTDGELAGAPIGAGSVPAPHITGCTAATVVLGVSIKITWTVPDAAYTGSQVTVYGNSDLLSLIDNTSLLAGATTSGPSAGVYTTLYTGGLLSGTLGKTYYVALVGTQPSGWTSPASRVAAVVPALLGTGTCTIDLNG